MNTSTAASSNRPRRVRFIAGASVSLVTGLLLIGACADANSGKSADAPARGSAVCQDWQKAACDFFVRCGAMERAACDDDYRAITCADDDAARACARAFRASDCNTFPPDCQATDLADRTVAAAACNDFIDATCAADERCGGVPATCRTQVTATFDCSKAVGTSPSLESCLKELGTLDCGAVEGPTSCEGAIKVDGNATGA